MLNLIHIGIIWRYPVFQASRTSSSSQPTTPTQNPAWKSSATTKVNLLTIYCVHYTYTIYKMQTKQSYNEKGSSSL